MRFLPLVIQGVAGLLPTVKVPILGHHVFPGGGFNNVPDAIITAGVKTKSTGDGTADVAGMLTCPVLPLDDFDKTGTKVRRNNNY